MPRIRPIVVTTDWHTVLDRWLTRIETEADQHLDLGIVDAAAEVVETLHKRRRGLRGALRRFGNVLGELGWPLEQLSAWLAALSTLTSRSRRVELRSFESMAALTVVGVIFLPGQFLTGVFGMNFKRMPGLESEWGFFAFWVAAIASWLFMWLVFRRYRLV